MSTEETHHDFRDTNWSLIRELRADEPARREAALSVLFHTYQGPVYAYLRQLGCEPEHASELTQRFFVDKVLTGGLFEKADRRRARLRVLLRRSLERFRIDDYRRQRARGRGRTVSAEHLEKEEHVLPRRPDLSPLEVFQRRWASLVLEEAMRRCRSDFHERGREREWEAFYAWKVRPIVSGARPAPQAQIAEEVGLKSAAEVAQAVSRIRQRLHVHLHAVVSETVDDPEAVSGELDEIMRTLRAA